MLLNDHFTLFILPFSFDKTKFEGVSSQSVWEEASIEIDKKFLFQHVLETFDKENGCLQIYSLKDSFKGTNVAFPEIINLFKRDLILKDREGKNLGFRLINQKKKLNSTKLVLFPIASVGMLMFGAELINESATLDNLIQFNYVLHKYQYSKNYKINIVPKSNNENELGALKNVCRELNRFAKHKTNEDEENWDFAQLKNFLLHDIGIQDIQFNNPGRFHLFTYYQVDSQQSIENEEVQTDFVRIVRAQNQNYNAMKTDLHGNGLIERTFDEIYIGSSVESGGMMLDIRNHEVQFFSTFKDNALLSRYLWIYLLVYIQRISLINMIQKISRLNIDENNGLKDKLLEMISLHARILLKTSFSDISNFTQLNIYYAFLSKNLNLKQYYDELKEKTTEIEYILQERINREDKKRMHRMEMILAILLLPQIIFAFLSVLGDFFQVKTQHQLIDILFQNDGVVNSLVLIIMLSLVPTLFLLWLIVKESFKKDK